MAFFNFHHHCAQQKNGIYNWDIQEKCPEVFFSVGLHPHQITDEWRTCFEKVTTMAQKNKCVAIGECGLDGLIHVEDPIQQEVFKAHILLANELNKPLILHCVRRHHELFSFKKKSNVPMVVHGYNKNLSMARSLIFHGFYLSFGKSLLHRVSLQEILKEVSLDFIFLETDHADVEIDEVYQKVAEIKHMTLSDLQEKMNENLGKICIHQIV